MRDRAAHHHRRIFEAIKAGDATEAKQAMRAHMTQTKNDILLVTKPDSSPDPA
ncbi:MAG: FCD domain-containing protein [Actinomycetaceae bacterium]|nr:FCD domain-containing protein [Arcanobacterium sp.]MDD7687497.1 FCD domain-containing protein [Actinomycetaceae bacterium]MDY5272972.1 FCD domain-containing protein [Arcanobacterium sp.]